MPLQLLLLALLLLRAADVVVNMFLDILESIWEETTMFVAVEEQGLWQ